MPRFGSFNNRDLLALTMLAGRSMRADQGSEDSAKGVVAEAFAIADEFIAQSDGMWTAASREGARRRARSNDARR